METHFDMLIIDRSQKKFRLTPQGGKLHSSFKEIIRLYEKLECELQEMSNVVSGTIHLSTVNSIGLHELPSRLKTFIKKFPTVNVHVEYSYADKILEDVLGNVVDLGLVAYPGKDNKLNIIPLMEESLVLICEPGHPLAKRGQIKLADIAGENLVGFHIDIPTRRGIDRVLREKKIAVYPVMEFDNIETVKRAVEIGTGVAIVPEVTIVPEVKLGSLASVKFSDVQLARPVAVVHKKSKVLSPALENFLSILTGE